MNNLPDWLDRFLGGSEAAEEPAPGVRRLWPEQNPDDLEELIYLERRTP